VCVCVCVRTGRTEKRVAGRRRDERERRLIIIYRRRNWFCVLSFGTDEPRQRACAGEVRLRVEKKKIIKKSWQTGYAARARTHRRTIARMHTHAVFRVRIDVYSTWVCVCF